jgi:hypothetical protein
MESVFPRGRKTHTITPATSFYGYPWGLSAGSAPGGKYEVNTPMRYDGTACLGAAVAAAMYDPETGLGDVRRWLSGPYGGRIWGRYGLADSVNFDDPAAEWVAPDVHAITVGPEFLAFAGHAPETAIGSVFNEIPAVKRGLATAFSKSRWADRGAPYGRLGLPEHAPLFCNSTWKRVAGSPWELPCQRPD